MKIGVIGLGLIGGSILKRLKEKGFYLLAVSKSSCEKARAYCDECSNELSLLKSADVVFVCSEMSKTLSVLDELESIVSSDTIVADVCSLKEFVCQKPRPYKFIGSHPMAGTEFSGFEHSFPELFEGAKWVLAKHNETLEYLISQMGAKTTIMDPKEHDRAAAAISHLPMLLANALFGAIQNDTSAKTLAASGFRDMTRLAMTSPALANDMLELNAENIDTALEKVIEYARHLKKLNANERIETLEENSKLRAKMYENGRNVLQ